MCTVVISELHKKDFFFEKSELITNNNNKKKPGHLIHFILVWKSGIVTEAYQCTRNVIANSNIWIFGFRSQQLFRYFFVLLTFFKLFFNM